MHNNIYLKNCYTFSICNTCSIETLLYSVHVTILHLGLRLEN
ncbi:hypothetical protein P5673_027024 [Acropora cervicornis]|uniref:Uncharacterized protein n=1 Tax=Acropora cervicornis TaxID=6130 RepID=A0AAD9Q0E5_ACRCE|nr:hypothetical protein P5673_027024 [Acropora cervicornis]